jgi:jumonji domain-containing protein 7
MHKDHYENIFCVASGMKSFTICPPGDSIYFQEGSFASGEFYHDSNGWSVKLDGEGGESDKVRWIDIDIERLIDDYNQSNFRSDYIMEKYPHLPHLRFVHPKKITLEAGDMFYLPAFWYHRVTQLCETVAVNYWYDMRFDSPYWCYFNLLQNLNHATVDDDKDKRE